MDDDRAATRYHRLRLALGALRIGLSGLYLAAVALVDGGRALSHLADRAGSAWWWWLLVVAVIIGAGHAVLTFPLGWLSGYVLPRRYGLLHQPFRSWLADRLKAAVLGGTLGLVVLEAVYGLMRLTSLWWLLAASLVTLVSLFMATVFPIWILPLFYRSTPLGDEALRERLLRLATRAGVPAIDVSLVNQSTKSRTANAALTGMGRTRRIILFDTLVRDFAGDEIEAVLAHELAHHLHHDVWRGLATQAALTLGAFWIADRALRVLVPGAALAGPADPAGLPWFALVLGGLGLVATPLVNAVSRRFERQADDRSLALTGDVEAFVRAMERLARLNLARRRPPRLEEALLHSHPSIERRIGRARATSRGGMLAPASD
jgi:STE24 endopeptidase